MYSVHSSTLYTHTMTRICAASHDMRGVGHYARVCVLVILCMCMFSVLAHDKKLHSRELYAPVPNKAMQLPLPALVKNSGDDAFLSASPHNSATLRPVSQKNDGAPKSNIFFPLARNSSTSAHELSDHFCGLTSLSCPTEAPICCGTYPFLYCVAAGRKCCNAPRSLTATNCQQGEQCCTSENNAVCCAPKTHCVVTPKTPLAPAWAHCVESDVCSAFDNVDDCVNNRTAQMAGCGWCCADQRCVSTRSERTIHASHAMGDDMLADLRARASPFVCRDDRQPITAGQQCESRCAYATTCAMCIANNNIEYNYSVRLPGSGKKSAAKHQARTATVHTNSDADADDAHQMCRADTNFSMSRVWSTVIHGKAHEDRHVSSLATDKCGWCCATMSCMPISDMSQRCDNTEYVDLDISCAGCMYNGTGTDQVFISSSARLLLAISSLVVFIGLLSLLAVVCDLVYTFSMSIAPESDENSQFNAQQAIRRYGFELILGKTGLPVAPTLNAQSPPAPPSSPPATAALSSQNAQMEDAHVEGDASAAADDVPPTTIAPLAGACADVDVCETYGVMTPAPRSDDQQQQTDVGVSAPERNAMPLSRILNSDQLCMVTAASDAEALVAVPRSTAHTSDEMIGLPNERSTDAVACLRRPKKAAKEPPLPRISCSRCHRSLQILRLETRTTNPAHVGHISTACNADAVHTTRPMATSPAGESAAVGVPRSGEVDNAVPSSLLTRPIFSMIETPLVQIAANHREEATAKPAVTSDADDGAVLLLPCNHKVCYACAGLAAACKRVAPGDGSVGMGSSVGVHIRESDANTNSTPSTHRALLPPGEPYRSKMQICEPLEKVEKRLRRHCRNKCPVCARHIDDILLTKNILFL